MMWKKMITSSNPKTITKDNTKDFIKTKFTTNTKAEAEAKNKTEDSIYTRDKYEYKECHKEFRSKTALFTHSYSHNRKYLENTEYFDLNSSQNMKDFYITDKVGSYIEDIDEAINNSLEEIKTFISSEKLRILNIRSQLSVSTRREPKMNLKLLKYSSSLTILKIMQYMNVVTSNNG